MENYQQQKSSSCLFLPKRGFTLIELLTVIAIIGILSSIVVAGLYEPRQKAKEAMAGRNVKELNQAISLFDFDYGRYPGTAGVEENSQENSDTGWNQGDGTLYNDLVPKYLTRLPTDSLITYYYEPDEGVARFEPPPSLDPEPEPDPNPGPGPEPEPNPGPGPDPSGPNIAITTCGTDIIESGNYFIEPEDGLDGDGGSYCVFIQPGVSNVFLDCQNKFIRNVQSGIVLHQGNDVEIKNCHLINNSMNAISVANSYDVWISNNYIEDNNRGVYIANSDRVFVQNNFFKDSNWSAVTINKLPGGEAGLHHNFFIAGNVFESNQTDIFTGSGGAEYQDSLPIRDVVIRDNFFTSSDRGIFLSYTHNALVASNEIPSIYQAFETHYSQGVIFEDNNVNKVSFGNAVGLINSRDLIFRRNTLESIENGPVVNSQGFIEVGYSSGVTFEDNSIITHNHFTRQNYFYDVSDFTVSGNSFIGHNSRRLLDLRNLEGITVGGEIKENTFGLSTNNTDSLFISPDISVPINVVNNNFSVTTGLAVQSGGENTTIGANWYGTTNCSVISGLLSPVPNPLSYLNNIWPSGSVQTCP
ncbi:MAG: right-handed parallel beta-helix repeat-containing protein [Candidatus Paceibacterota bacterium]